MFLLRFFSIGSDKDFVRVGLYQVLCPISQNHQRIANITIELHQTHRGLNVALIFNRHCIYVMKMIEISLFKAICTIGILNNRMAC